MNEGSYNATQILHPQSIDLMQTMQYSMTGTEYSGLTVTGQALGWRLYANSIVGRPGSMPSYRAKIAFKTAINGKYAIIFMVNRGNVLVADSYLANTFLPTITEILFEEAVRLFAL